jgi:hypothetical protein
MNDAIVLPIDIGVGTEREVQTLLADPWRKLVLNVTGRAYPLAPGVIVPVDAHAVHSVQAEPELAMLLTFFRQPETAIGEETTARFGGC